jgi:16S rRNA (guanine527-N7)-methyltransferase
MTQGDIADHLQRLNVSRETEALFRQYAALLEKWNAKINLVSASSLGELWSRHILDSTQLWTFGKHSGRWADLGSGGGFPGIAIAIMGRKIPGFSMVLVESDQRKAAFLRTVIRELRLPARVVAQRIEDAEPLLAETLTARALAPLTDLLAYAERHLAAGGTALFPKGEKAEAEIAEALEKWRFRCEKHPSITDENSTILAVGDISRV